MPTENDSSHELRNRLSVVLGHARLLEASSLDDAQRRHVLEIITACRDEGDILLRLERHLGVTLNQTESTDNGMCDEPAIAFDELRSLLDCFLAELIDETRGRRRINLGIVKTPAVCTTCGERTDSMPLGFALTAPDLRLTTSAVRGMLAKQRSATESIHEVGGHLVISAGVNSTVITLFFPLLS